MPVKAKYVHKNLTARDWRRLVRFYCEVFGCVPKPPERDLSGDWRDALTGLSGAHLTAGASGIRSGRSHLGNFWLRTAAGSRPTGRERTGSGHLAFLVDDVEGALKQVIHAGGGSVGSVITTAVAGVGELHVVYARDPEGNIIELQHWS